MQFQPNADEGVSEKLDEGIEENEEKEEEEEKKLEVRADSSTDDDDELPLQAQQVSDCCTQSTLLHL